MSEVIVKMHNICKVYDNGIVANDNACIEVNRGEIHALAGENGAGKSTLMKILYGLERPDGGEIFIDGKLVTISNSALAASLGIGMVHQHFMLVDELSVVDNIMLGIEIGKYGILNRKASVELVKKLSEEYGMPVEPNELVGNLSLVQKQKVEILKVLARNAKIIILDEPTAVLTPQETQEFFKQLLTLKNRGYTIIIITHKLNEIKQICDRITVMRNGRFMGVRKVSEVTEEDISRMMVGRDVIKKVAKTVAQPAEKVLEISHVNKTFVKGKLALSDLSFAVRKKEIVCICGVEGNGQREIVKIITGFDGDYSGQVTINGRDIRRKSIKKIREMGQSHIPEDRTMYGVDVSSSIADNIVSTTINEVSNFGLINSSKVEKIAAECVSDYQIKCEDCHQKAGMLSGGNMQKVVVARETKELPALLIADQPTRGVDVGAIEFIHAKLVQLRDDGCAVLLISSDLGEVFALSDRILVFHGGKIVADIDDVKSITEEELGQYMLGIKTMERAANE